MKTISVKVIIYTLTDVNGEICTCVVEDHSDTVTYNGIGSDGKRHYYDGYEGIHSYDWADKLGMKVDCYEKTIDLNVG
jgi:hypothetical protein